MKIGAWQIDPDANELRAGDQRRRLTPKAMDVLVLLFRANGEVVTRIALMDQVGLSDEGLSRLINEVREAFGDNARAPHTIETIPRRGYRLIGLDRQASSSAANRRPRPRSMIKAAGLVVVLILLFMIAAQSILRKHTPATPDYQASRVVRLTPTEERAILPHLDGRRVEFLKLGPDQDATQLMQIDLDTQIVQAVGVSSETLQRRRHLSGDIRMIEDAGQCRLLVPAFEPLPCRDVTGGLALFEADDLLAYEQAGGALGLVELSAGRVSLLSSPPEGQVDAQPAWSPSGSLAFIRGDEVRSEVFVRPAAGGEAVAVSDDHQAVFDLEWLDSHHLLLASDRTGTRRLWALDTRSQLWTDLHQPDVWRLSVKAPDVVFERPVFRADIVRWDGNETTSVVDSARFDNHPAVSPDGTHLAFVSMRSGVPSLWLSDALGGSASLLLSPGGGRITRPVWQDDQHLTYLEYSDAAVRLRSISLDREVRDIELGELIPREAAYDGEGQLHVIGELAGQSGLYRLGNGQPVRLLAGDFQRLVATGPNLLLGDRDRGMIRRFDPIGGAVDLVQSDNLHWTAAGNRLYFVREGAVHVYHLHSAEQQKLDAPVPTVIGLGLAVHSINGDLYVSINRGHRAALYHLRVSVTEP